MSTIDSITNWFAAWFRDIGLSAAAPALQAGFLYSVLALLIGIYVWVRISSSGEISGLLQLWIRTKQLEKQSIQLANENDQLRSQILGLYDYLVQFERKPGPDNQQPVQLSSLLHREDLARSPDFEVIADDYPKIKFPAKIGTIRRLSRNKLAEQAGIDLAAERVSIQTRAIEAKASATVLGQRKETVGGVPEASAASGQVSANTVRSGLAKTRGELFTKLSSLFRNKQESSARTIEGLEQLLITSDLGVKTAALLLARVRERFAGAAGLEESELRKFLQQEILAIVDSGRPPEILPVKRDGKPTVVLVVGVNGVGKTTTIGKLAWQFRAQGKRVLVAACDTFRAAAVEQLQVWAERSGVELVRGAETAKPATVAYEAVHRAQLEGYDVLLIDTAGRLHTRVNLMNELANVVRIVEREQPGAPHETILVVDASTGQNALQQAIEFNNKAGLTGIVITKLDGTSKGGIVVAIKNELNIPIRYIGVGEGVTDLRLFSASEFTEALFASDQRAELHQAA